MVQATWSELSLRDFESSSLAEQNVIQGAAHILEVDLGVTERCIVVTERGQWPDQFNAGRISWYQHLALLSVLIAAPWIRFTHHDKDTGVGVQRAVDEPFNTHSWPSRSIRSSMLVASLEATCGSVIT